MNRLILKYAYPLTAVILLILAWVVYQRVSHGWAAAVPLAIAAVIVWAVGAPVFLFLWPRITVTGFKRAILRQGVGEGPIPLNTLRAAPVRSSASAASGSVLATGTDEVVYVSGWLELGAAPQVLHVPDMAGRYYSVQFTDEAKSSNFAYVGTRTTGTGAGEYLISGPRWAGPVPPGMARIASPTDGVLVIGRVHVESEDDRRTAYELAQQLRHRAEPVARIRARAVRHTVGSGPQLRTSARSYATGTSSCSKVHDRGSLSSRHRSNCAV